MWGTCLVVQWLRLHASTVGGRGSIPGWELRPCSVVKKYIMYIEHDFGIYGVQIAMMKTSRLTSKQNAFLSTENLSNKSFLTWPKISKNF